jgi:hypothetical protein
MLYKRFCQWSQHAVSKLEWHLYQLPHLSTSDLGRVETHVDESIFHRTRQHGVGRLEHFERADLDATRRVHYKLSQDLARDVCSLEWWAVWP